MTKRAIGVMTMVMMFAACGDDDVSLDAGLADAAPQDAGTDVPIDATPDDAQADDAMLEPALYAQPESVVWDQTNDVWYVSNVSGESTVADGEGWIVRLDREGEMEDARWVSGLNAPKGLAILGEFLYVADLTEVVQINLADGVVASRIACPDAAFLNDITADDDTIYISDTFTSAIYRWQPGDDTAAIWVQDDMLAAVNGLVVDGDVVIAGTIGDFMDLEDLGHLISVDRGDGTITLIASEIAKFDGLVVDGEGYLATDFRGQLLRVTRAGVVTVIDDLTMSAGFTSAADLGFDSVRRLAAIPDLFASRVLFLNIP